LPQRHREHREKIFGNLLRSNKKSPLERGAALAAGCVPSLKLFFFRPFYYFRGCISKFPHQTHPGTIVPPLSRGDFFVALQQLQIFEVSLTEKVRMPDYGI